MTLQQILTQTDTLSPNACPAQWKCDSLAFLDLEVLETLIHSHTPVDALYTELVAEDLLYTPAATDRVLLIPDPWAAGIYVPFLRAAVARYACDYAQAQQLEGEYRQAYQKYRDWYGRTHCPLPAGRWAV